MPGCERSAFEDDAAAVGPTSSCAWDRRSTPIFLDGPHSRAAQPSSRLANSGDDVAARSMHDCGGLVEVDFVSADVVSAPPNYTA